MNKNIKNTLRIGIIAAASAAAMVSCSDTWDDHYNDGPSSLSFNGTTMQALEQMAPDFAKVVKLYGYDRELSSENVYTVWAPADGSFNLSDYADVQVVDGQTVLTKKDGADEVLDHFIKNHVARYAISQNGTEQDVKLMSKKIETMTGNGTGEGTFGERTITKSNLSCTNGVLHILDGELDYRHNIFEKIKSLYNPETDDVSLYAFLKIFDKDSLDENKSVSNGMDEYGNTVWEDSVVIRNNTVLRNVDALIYEEDSSYIAILPSTEAYKKRLAIAKRLLDYNPYENTKNPDYKSDRYANMCDSLQDYNASMFAMTDLFFNKNANEYWQDSLKSTNYSSFNWPYNLYYAKEPLMGLHPDKEVNDILNKMGDPVQCSNGDLYLVDEYPMSVTEQFFKKQTVMASDLTLDQITGKDGKTKIYTKNVGITSISIGTLYDYQCDTIWEGVPRESQIVRVDSTFLGTRDYYFFDVPELGNTQPAIAFDLENLLSGTYDMYLVTCPIWAKTGFNNGESYQDDPRPYRFYVNIYERMDDNAFVGSPTRLTPPEDAIVMEKQGNYFITDCHEKIDTLHLGEYTFKHSYYNIKGDDGVGAIIQFDVKVGNGDKGNYSREMLISSIILKPKFDATEEEQE
jgi:hypothetical protein